MQVRQKPIQAEKIFCKKPKDYPSTFYALRQWASAFYNIKQDFSPSNACKAKAYTSRDCLNFFTPPEFVYVIWELLTFTIAKYKSSKFWYCTSETKILQSYFEIANSESESQQSTFEQLNKSEWFYKENTVKYCSFH